MNIKKATEIIRLTNETVKNWTTFAEATKVEVKLREAIVTTLIRFYYELF